MIWYCLFFRVALAVLLLVVPHSSWPLWSLPLWYVDKPLLVFCPFGIFLFEITWDSNLKHILPQGGTGKQETGEGGLAKGLTCQVDLCVAKQLHVNVAQLQKLHKSCPFQRPMFRRCRGHRTKWLVAFWNGPNFFARLTWNFLPFPEASTSQGASWLRWIGWIGTPIIISHSITSITIQFSSSPSKASSSETQTNDMDKPYNDSSCAEWLLAKTRASKCPADL